MPYIQDLISRNKSEPDENILLKAQIYDSSYTLDDIRNARNPKVKQQASTKPVEAKPVSQKQLPQQKAVEQTKGQALPTKPAKQEAPIVQPIQAGRLSENPAFSAYNLLFPDRNPLQELEPLPSVNELGTVDIAPSNPYDTATESFTQNVITKTKRLPNQPKVEAKPQVNYVKSAQVIKTNEAKVKKLESFKANPSKDALDEETVSLVSYENGVKLSPDAVFEIASIDKQLQQKVPSAGSTIANQSISESAKQSLLAKKQAILGVEQTKNIQNAIVSKSYKNDEEKGLEKGTTLNMTAYDIANTEFKGFDEFEDISGTDSTGRIKLIKSKEERKAYNSILGATKNAYQQFLANPNNDDAKNRYLFALKEYDKYKASFFEKEILTSGIPYFDFDIQDVVTQVDASKLTEANASPTEKLSALIISTKSQINNPTTSEDKRKDLKSKLNRLSELQLTGSSSLVSESARPFEQALQGFAGGLLGGFGFDTESTQQKTVQQAQELQQEGITPSKQVEQGTEQASVSSLPQEVGNVLGGTAGFLGAMIPVGRGISILGNLAKFSRVTNYLKAVQATTTGATRLGAVGARLGINALKTGASYGLTSAVQNTITNGVNYAQGQDTKTAGDIADEGLNQFLVGATTGTVMPLVEKAFGKVASLLSKNDSSTIGKIWSNAVIKSVGNVATNIVKETGEEIQEQATENAVNEGFDSAYQKTVDLLNINEGTESEQNRKKAFFISIALFAGGMGSVNVASQINREKYSGLLTRSELAELSKLANTVENGRDYNYHSKRTSTELQEDYTQKKEALNELKAKENKTADDNTSISSLEAEMGIMELVSKRKQRAKDSFNVGGASVVDINNSNSEAFKPFVASPLSEVNSNDLAGGKQDVKDSIEKLKRGEQLTVEEAHELASHLNVSVAGTTDEVLYLQSEKDQIGQAKAVTEALATQEALTPKEYAKGEKSTNADGTTSVKRWYQLGDAQVAVSGRLNTNGKYEKGVQVEVLDSKGQKKASFALDNTFLNQTDAIEKSITNNDDVQKNGVADLIGDGAVMIEKTSKTTATYDPQGKLIASDTKQIPNTDITATVPNAFHNTYKELTEEQKDGISNIEGEVTQDNLARLGLSDKQISNLLGSLQNQTPNVKAYLDKRGQTDLNVAPAITTTTTQTQAQAQATTPDPQPTVATEPEQATLENPNATFENNVLEYDANGKKVQATFDNDGKVETLNVDGTVVPKTIMSGGVLGIGAKEVANPEYTALETEAKTKAEQAQAYQEQVDSTKATYNEAENTFEKDGDTYRFDEDELAYKNGKGEALKETDIKQSDKGAFGTYTEVSKSTASLGKLKSSTGFADATKGTTSDEVRASLKAFRERNKDKRGSGINALRKEATELANEKIAKFEGKQAEVQTKEEEAKAKAEEKERLKQEAEQAKQEAKEKAEEEKKFKAEVEAKKKLYTDGIKEAKTLQELSDIYDEILNDSLIEDAEQFEKLIDEKYNVIDSKEKKEKLAKDKEKANTEFEGLLFELKTAVTEEDTIKALEAIDAIDESLLSNTNKKLYNKLIASIVEVSDIETILNSNLTNDEKRRRLVILKESVKGAVSGSNPIIAKMNDAIKTLTPSKTKPSVTKQEQDKVSLQAKNLLANVVSLMGQPSIRKYIGAIRTTYNNLLTISDSLQQSYASKFKDLQEVMSVLNSYSDVLDSKKWTTEEDIKRVNSLKSKLMDLVEKGNTIALKVNNKLKPRQDKVKDETTTNTGATAKTSTEGRENQGNETNQTGTIERATTTEGQRSEAQAQAQETQSAKQNRGQAKATKTLKPKEATKQGQEEKVGFNVGDIVQINEKEGNWKISSINTDGTFNLVKINEPNRTYKEATSDELVKQQKTDEQGNITDEDKTILQRLFDRLFPNIVKWTDAEALDILRSSKEVKQLPFGFVYQGKVWINPTRESLDTRMHEYAGHIFMAYAKDVMPALHKRLLDLVSTAPKEVVNRVKRLYPELDENSEAFKEEVIATMMGEKNIPNIEKAIKNAKLESLKANPNPLVVFAGKVANALKKMYDSFMKSVGFKKDYLSLDKFRQLTLEDAMDYIGKGILEGDVKVDVTSEQLAKSEKMSEQRQDDYQGFSNYNSSDFSDSQTKKKLNDILSIFTNEEVFEVVNEDGKTEYKYIDRADTNKMKAVNMDKIKFFFKGQLDAYLKANPDVLDRNSDGSKFEAFTDALMGDPALSPLEKQVIFGELLKDLYAQESPNILRVVKVQMAIQQQARVAGQVLAFQKYFQNQLVSDAVAHLRNVGLGEKADMILKLQEKWESDISRNSVASELYDARTKIAQLEEQVDQQYTDELQEKLEKARERAEMLEEEVRNVASELSESVEGLTGKKLVSGGRKKVSQTAVAKTKSKLKSMAKNLTEIIKNAEC